MHHGATLDREEPGYDSAPEVLVLGGGATGLGAAFELNETGTPYLLFERADEVGGLARTLRFGETEAFRTDIGPHLLAMGDENVRECVRRVDCGGRRVRDYTRKLYLRGGLVDVPPNPVELVSRVGVTPLLQCAPGYLTAQLRSEVRNLDHETFDGSVGEYLETTYGKRTVETFGILDYFEKAWGISPYDVPSDVSYGRIGLVSLRQLATTVVEAVRTRVVDDGDDETSGEPPWYPDRGMGTFHAALRDVASTRESSTVATNAEVEEVRHDDGEITEVTATVDGSTVSVEPGRVVSTVPLPVFVRLLNPVPQEVRAAVDDLRYRSYIGFLVTIDERSVFDEANVVFCPDMDVPFTRVIEPKNFSRAMAPDGRTSLFFGIFCWNRDDLWDASDRELLAECTGWLSDVGVAEEDVLDTHSVRFEYAYPVQNRRTAAAMDELRSFAEGLENCRIAGRSGAYRYVNQANALKMGMSAATE